MFHNRFFVLFYNNCLKKCWSVSGDFLKNIYSILYTINSIYSIYIEFVFSLCTNCEENTKYCTYLFNEV